MSQLQPLPPFITDPFALKILLELEGRASANAIREYVSKNYNTKKFPHAMQYLMTQYNGLRKAGFIDSKREKSDLVMWIKDDAREAAKNMVKQYDAARKE